MCIYIPHISHIIHQTHYEKSDWSRAFNQFTIACELDMINAISAADIAFINSSLWKRVIVWERCRAASGYGIIWGDADRNKQEEFSAECHSVDWFLTELQIAIRSRLLF